MSTTSPVLKLPSGAEIPVLGFGTWQLPAEVSAEAVYTAIKVGYRHIDAAQIYGNQKEVGQGIQRAIDEKIIESRKDLWITSKIWNDDHKNVDAAVERILSELAIDYLDLLLIHWNVHWVKGAGRPLEWYDDITSVDTYKAMEKYVDNGKVKFLGLSNFSAEDFEAVHSAATHKPITNQVEAHPVWNQFDLENDIKPLDAFITAYSPLNMNVPADPSQHHPLSTDPIITSIAQKHGVTWAQVAIRWAIDLGRVVIPKTATLSRIPENFKVLDFKLDKDDVKQINSIEPQVRGLNPVGWLQGKPDVPYFANF